MIKTGDQIKNEKAKLIFLANKCSESNFAMLPKELLFTIGNLSLSFFQAPIRGKYTKPVITDLPKKKSENCVVQ